MDASILFDGGGETTAQAVTQALTRRGLCVMRSFDLRSALADHSGCACPYHGTARCACQFVVLLIYGEIVEPVVLTAHSRDNRTQVQIVHDANAQPDPRLADQVMAALLEAALTLRAARVQSAEVTTHAE